MSANTRPEPSTEDSAWVKRLHEVVDELALPIALEHGPRLRCTRGCHECCADGLSVLEIEASLIRLHYGELLARGEPHTGDGCAFLDERGACRIYEHRPYVCRTQGLPLRWLESEDEAAPVELRDICPLNEPGPALVDLAASSCWTLGPIEQRLAKRQAAADGGAGRRVALRSLFAVAKSHLPVVR